ncbi:hypothetical protein VTK73DRAFT_10354 [Phialemonium thermophilum]|uniref:Terpene synthase n=1 Tax=Phialemonium thermophilum TaxID=223376 RepID=A0ABR3XG58_9PEZI
MDVATASPLSPDTLADNSHYSASPVETAAENSDLNVVPRTVDVPFHLLGMSQPTNPSQALAMEFKGKVLEVPNMMVALEGWPYREKNKYYEQMRDIFNETLDRVIPDPRRCEKFKECDFALFSALWWPHAEWEDFYSAAFFALWIFIWDDTLDGDNSGDREISDDFEKASKFRAQTLDYIKHCLGLREENDGAKPGFPSLSCGLFEDFSRRVVEKFAKDRVQRVYDEIARYVHECEVEQTYRLTGRIPTLDEYLENRLGTSAVFILCGIFELFVDDALPDWMMKSPEMDVIWRETNLAIIIINDILSLKKEMATESLVSLIPVLYQEGITWGEIVPELIEELQLCRLRLEEAFEKLEKDSAGNARLLKDLRTYVDVCRTSTTGTYIYTIESKRYKIAQDVRSDMSATIVL